MSEWDREHWVPGGGDPFVFFVIVGQTPESFEINATEYRTAGLPEGIEVRAFNRHKNGEYIDGFTEGYAWDYFARRQAPLAGAVKDASDCLVVAGSVSDPPNLVYLRDAVGLTTFILDHGGLAVYDMQTLAWFGPREWHEHIFGPDRPLPRRHVITLLSSEEQRGFTWFHTRGLRKFGRPDVSIHNVPLHMSDVATNLCGRLIEYQAFGGVVDEGQPIRMEGLPPGAAAHRRGDLDDPNFNNLHLEIVWPSV